MSSGEEDVRRSEVVIVRRRSDDGEGGHHGGVWKIAYADFMTAMMAFFLVMWLVNASDKQVRQQVARYFNPIRMTDEVSGAKGVQKMKPGTGPQSDNAAPEKSGGAPTESPLHGDSKEGKADTPDKVTSFTSQDLFADPYGVLARIAAQAPKAPLGQGAATEKRQGLSRSFRAGLSALECRTTDAESAAWRRPRCAEVCRGAACRNDRAGEERKAEGSWLLVAHGAERK